MAKYRIKTIQAEGPVLMNKCFPYKVDGRVPMNKYYPQYKKWNLFWVNIGCRNQRVENNMIALIFPNYEWYYKEEDAQVCIKEHFESLS